MSGEKQKQVGMRVGACAYCGSGPLTPNHECLQMRLSKEKKMNKDILERARKLIANKMLPEFPVTMDSPRKILNELIQEIEKLRSPSHWDKYVRIATPKDYMEQEKKIKTLTKELEEWKSALVKNNDSWNERVKSLMATEQRLGDIIRDLEAQLAESKKKVDSLNRDLGNQGCFKPTGSTPK